jgi:hypothetical protein
MTNPHTHDVFGLCGDGRTNDGNANNAEDQPAENIPDSVSASDFSRRFVKVNAEFDAA